MGTRGEPGDQRGNLATWARARGRFLGRARGLGTKGHNGRGLGQGEGKGEGLAWAGRGGWGTYGEPSGNYRGALIYGEPSGNLERGGPEGQLDNTNINMLTLDTVIPHIQHTSIQPRVIAVYNTACGRFTATYT